LYAQSRDRSEQKSITNVGKISCGHSHAGTPKKFQSTHIGYIWGASRGHLCDSMASCY